MSATGRGTRRTLIVAKTYPASSMPCVVMVGVAGDKQAQELRALSTALGSARPARGVHPAATPV